MGAISSSQYSWNEVSVVIGGRVLEGITEVEYTEKQDKETLYGCGNTPHCIIRGNITYEGKITLWQSEIEAMIQSAPNKSLLALKFDVVITYVPYDGGMIVVDVLSGCEFSEIKKGMKQGDKNMLVEMPIVFLNIKPQQ